MSTVTGLNQTGLFIYSYTDDGHVKQQQITYDADSQADTTVNFTYSPAGRLSGRTETGNGANPSAAGFGYDAYGQLNSAIYPGQSQITGYEYSPEGELTSFGLNQQLQAFNYTMRGEMLALAPLGVGNTPTYAFANGAQVPLPGHSASTQSTWDDRMGVSTKLVSDVGYPDESTQAFGYDSSGRQTLESQNNCDMGSCSDMISSSMGRTYDVDNHAIDTTQSWTWVKQGPVGGGGTAANVSVYDWGPTDHPIRIGSADSTTSTPPPATAATFDTLHWDGDQLIFETNSNSKVDDIKVGTSGDITPLNTAGFTGITFWDRGPSGAVIYCHNKTGSAGSGQIATAAWPMGYPSTPCGSVFNQPPSGSFPSSISWFNGPGFRGAPRSGGVGQGGIVGMYKPDGITDGVNTIQGVRTVDANSGTWTTPDAFAGVVDDPSTQKSYMWNGNNPMTYSDPSGYMVGGGAYTSGIMWTGADNCEMAGCGTGLDATDASASPPAGAPGSACAGTDANHDCFPEGVGIAPLAGSSVPETHSIDNATKAAAAAYSFIQTEGEVSCAVYCHGTACGFGYAYVVPRDKVGNAESPLLGDRGYVGATQAAFWHVHPGMDSTNSMAGHLQSAQEWFRSNPNAPPIYSIYTLLNGTLYVQDYEFSTTTEQMPSVVK